MDTCRPQDYDYSLKYVIVGDSNVGKTCLAEQFVYRPKQFTAVHQPTLGFEYSTKKVVMAGRRVRIQVWDTAGQEKFRSISHRYYRGSSVAMIVYDVAAPKTFENVAYWLREITETCGDRARIILVGNKSDEADRQVSYARGSEFAAKNQIPHFVETSAKEGTGIDKAFMDPATEVMYYLETQRPDLTESMGITLGPEHEDYEPPKDDYNGGCAC